MITTDSVKASRPKEIALTEEDARAMAKPSCKYCNGLGREGYEKGHKRFIACRCVIKKMAKKGYRRM